VWYNPGGMVSLDQVSASQARVEIARAVGNLSHEESGYLSNGYTVFTILIYIL
jgi:hypothetical protein